MGNVISRIDTSDYEKIEAEVQEYMREEEEQAEALSQSSTFNLVLLAKKYDDWFLDPIVGFLIPGFGDALSSIVVMPALYVSLVKLRSVKLFLAVLVPTLIDLLVGLFPFVGDFIDIFYKSNKIAARLVVGYIEEDEETLKEINKRAAWGVVILIVIGLIIYFLFAALVSLYHWLKDLW